MTLSYDTARCHGYDSPVCEGCRRLEPGHPTWQSYADFPEPVGECVHKIVHFGSVTTDLHGVER